MKTSGTVFFFVLALSGRILANEEAPKLAIAAATASPSLAKKLSSPAPLGASPAAKPISDTSVLEGTWRGIRKTAQGRPAQIVLRIHKGQDGLLRAEVENTTGAKTWQATPVILSGNRFTLNLGASTGSGPTVNGGVWAGEVQAESGMMTATWSKDGGDFPITLNRTEMFSRREPAPSAPAAPAGASLEEVLQAIDLHLVDRFDSARMFTVVEDADVKHTLASFTDTEKEVYNLRKPESKARFQNAGIQYLLLTTVEDFSDQTIDLAKGAIQTQNRETLANERTRIMRERVQQRRPGVSETYDNYGRERSYSAASSATQRQYDAHSQKQQILRLVVRYRLYNAKTGDLLQRMDRTFATNRTYVVLAQGNNALLSGDLLESAAKSISEWATVLVGEGIFPIKVLEKNGAEITINRGLDAGLQVGHTYNIYSLGKEIKDPTTGEILGHDEITVGRAAISELHQKFSKARVLEDKAISLGDSLRSALPR